MQTEYVVLTVMLVVVALIIGFVIWNQHFQKSEPIDPVYDAQENWKKYVASPAPSKERIDAILASEDTRTPTRSRVDEIIRNNTL